jgi:hypothetical protein
MCGRLRRGFQRLLPADVGCEAAIGVDVEEDVVETLLDQPVAQSDRSGIVRTRMKPPSLMQVRPGGLVVA